MSSLLPPIPSVFRKKESIPRRLEEDLRRLWLANGLVVSSRVSRSLANACRMRLLRGCDCGDISVMELFYGMVHEGSYNIKNELSVEEELLQATFGALYMDWGGPIGSDLSYTGRLSVDTQLHSLLFQANDLANGYRVGMRTIAVQHVFAVILRYVERFSNPLAAKMTPQSMSTILNMLLPKIWPLDPDGTWDEFFKRKDRSWPHPPIGSLVDLRREIKREHLCLGINQYSNVIAEMFRNAPRNGDFMMGLFAPWGRGKSTLMREVEDKLKETHCTLHFSAAKFPNRPEVWVHLYQEMLEKANGGNILERFNLRLLVGVDKHGWMRLIVGLLMTSVPLSLSFYLAKALVWWLSATIGFFGILMVISMVWKVFSISRLAVRAYAGVASHAEKLGLQATIGSDLESLLRAWVPYYGEVEERDDSSPRCVKLWRRVAFRFTSKGSKLGFRVGHVGFFCILVVMLILMAICLNYFLNIWVRGVTVGVLGNVFASLLPFFAVLCIFFWVYSIFKIEKKGKCVLLVVDDLDRCDPEQALVVIESIRWFLDKPDIVNRMQVAALMEYVTLETAFNIREAKSAVKMDSAEFRERLRCLREKLFMVELFLPPLDGKEVDEMLNRLLGEQAVLLRAGGNESVESEENPSEDVAEETKQCADDNRGRGRFHRPSDGSLTGFVGPSSIETTLNSQERIALLEALRFVHTSKITPRTIVSVLARYQMARRLHQELYGYVPANILANKLVERMFDIDFNSLKSKHHEGPDPIKLYYRVDKVLANVVLR